jgi:hypothetical protein
VEGRVKVWDWAIVVGPFDVESEGRVGGCEAQAALQAGVGFQVGVACPELVCKPLEGVRDADAQGAEALAVALEGYFKSRCAADEVVEDVRRQREALASVYVHLGVIVALGCFAPKLS